MSAVPAQLDWDARSLAATNRAVRQLRHKAAFAVCLQCRRAGRHYCEHPQCKRGTVAGASSSVVSTFGHIAVGTACCAQHCGSGCTVKGSCWPETALHKHLHYLMDERSPSASSWTQVSAHDRIDMGGCYAASSIAQALSKPQSLASGASCDKATLRIHQARALRPLGISLGCSRA